MSLIQEVVALVEDLGTASGEDLVKHLPGFTKDQIFQAMQNAKYRGRLKTVEPSHGRGPQGGKTGARYAIADPGAPKPAPKPKFVERPVSSVWELGQRASTISPSQLDALLCFNLARASQ